MSPVQDNRSRSIGIPAVMLLPPCWIEFAGQNRDHVFIVGARIVHQSLKSRFERRVLLWRNLRFQFRDALVIAGSLFAFSSAICVERSTSAFRPQLRFKRSVVPGDGQGPGKYQGR